MGQAQRVRRPAAEAAATTEEATRERRKSGHEKKKGEERESMSKWQNDKPGRPEGGEQGRMAGHVDEQKQRKNISGMKSIFLWNKPCFSPVNANTTIDDRKAKVKIILKKRRHQNVETLKC